MQMSFPDLNEKLLADAGGWQAMKHARALRESGCVISAHYAPPILKGVVRDGGTEYRAGLKIQSRTGIENICTCRASRERGMVCAHSLAVGLAVVLPKVELAERKLAAAGGEREKSEAPGDAECGPFFSVTDGSEFVTLHVVLSPNFRAAWEKDAVMTGVEAELAGRRVLLHALDKAKTFRCAPADARLVECLRGLSAGAPLSGMMTLPREKCLRLLEALAGHPRVTFGKSTRVDAGELLRTLRPESGTAAGAAAHAPTTPAGDAPQPGRGKFSLTLEGSLNHLEARLQCTYGQRVVTVGLTPPADRFSFADPENPSRRLARDITGEAAALERLTRHGFSGPDASGHFVLKREHAILNFFAAELPRMEREWEVGIGARFARVTGGIQRITPRIEIQSSGENWFDLQVSLATPGGETFSSAEIQRLLQTGQHHVRLKNNALAVFDGTMLDELQNVLIDASPRQLRPGTYRIGREQAGYLDAVIGEHAQVCGEPDWQSWTRSCRAQENLEPVPLGSLEEVLRPYQKEGVYWMHFLARNGLAGILADEMGLGKTLQALAFLRSLPNADDGGSGNGRGTPSLVVCPSSLLGNWRREAERFAPELRCLVIEGAGREASFARMQEADLVLTSYPLLRRDISKYSTVRFAAIVLDEAQHIKNPETQNAQAASALQSRHRFVLTGTPVENSVRDLWSIMHFLMPGYLGSREDFRERYELPISRGGADPEQSRLRKRLKPFLLRRLKKQVATDLPEKLDQVVFCELTPKQSEVYSALVESSRRQIHELAAEKDKNKGRMLILTALLRLRQACCDLRLLDLPGLKPGESSGKLDLLDELLREALDGGHRVLIFSQFVSMLSLIRGQLMQSNTPFSYLDGQTKDRMAAVDSFQNDESIPVFLISLKAGGTGLNLTAADTVIHFDPWWNPAIEAQATDRAHRIGQKRVVSSYKLIARGTVEEKILNLQRAKRDIIAATVESDEPLMSGLSMDEIESLLI